jgi:hypothetical protein
MKLFVCHMVGSNTFIDLLCTGTCIAGSQVEDYQVLGCLSRGCKLCGESCTSALLFCKDVLVSLRRTQYVIPLKAEPVCSVGNNF